MLACLQLDVATSYKELAPGLTIGVVGTLPNPESGAPGGRRGSCKALSPGLPRRMLPRCGCGRPHALDAPLLHLVHAGKLAVDYAHPHAHLKSLVTLTAAPKVDVAGKARSGREGGGGAGQEGRPREPAASLRRSLLLLLHDWTESTALLHLRPALGRSSIARSVTAEPASPSLRGGTDLFVRRPLPPSPAAAATTGFEGVTVGGEASYDTAKSAITKVGAVGWGCRLGIATGKAAAACCTRRARRPGHPAQRQRPLGRQRAEGRAQSLCVEARSVGC